MAPKRSAQITGCRHARITSLAPILAAPQSLAHLFRAKVIFRSQSLQLATMILHYITIHRSRLIYQERFLDHDERPRSRTT